MKGKRHFGFTLDEVNFDILLNVDAKGGKKRGGRGVDD